MKELVAKKYVKALMSDLNRGDLEKFITNLSVIVNAFKIHKFRNINLSKRKKR